MDCKRVDILSAIGPKVSSGTESPASTTAPTRIRTRTLLLALSSCNTIAMTQPPHVERTMHRPNEMNPRPPATQRTLCVPAMVKVRSEEHTSELQSHHDL